MLIIFDLDGVLTDSRETHYIALNDALQLVNEKYVISREDHLATYDGLPTSKKLELLTKTKGLDKGLYDFIWVKKQEETINLLGNIKVNPKLINILSELKYKNHKIAVASNSIRKSIEICLKSLGIHDLVDYFVSNEDVGNPKPHPEMYWKCMTFLKYLPKDTIILEDSHIGREAALSSGCPNLIPITKPEDVTLELILDKIDMVNKTKNTLYIPWIDKKLNVLIPMAGLGSRFKDAGYKDPKPLIEFNSKPMIFNVVENLNIEANYIFLVLKETYEEYHLGRLLNILKPNCKIVIVNTVTDGAARTSLLAKEYIDNNSPLLIVNSDQIMDWNSNECMYAFSNENIDGGILVFNANDPKWSYAKLGDNGFVEQVAEKKVISDMATVGVYFWSNGSDYVKYAEQMIASNVRTNNEFYICPVYNEAINDGKKIRIKFVNKMWGVGTPDDLNTYLNEMN